MTVAHSANSNGGGGQSTNGTVTGNNITQTLATLNTITIGASDTTCIIFLEYNAAPTTTGWTVKVGSATAALIASSSFNESTGAQVSIIAFEVKSPPSGAQTIQVANSGAAFTTPGVAAYQGAQSFTGSDTVNPSVAFGNATGTAGNPATTNASGSSIPSTDMVAAWFSNANGDFGTVVGSYGATGGTGLTFVDHANGTVNNVGETFAAGNNAAITMTATQNASDGYAALGIWVKVPASAVVETNTSFKGRVYPPQWNVNRQLFRISAQDTSSFGVETNPHWVGKTQPIPWNINKALFRNSAVDVPVISIDTPIYFKPGTYPIKWNLDLRLRQNTAQDFSSFGVETNPHWMDTPYKWPVQWNLTPRQSPAIDVPTAVVETNPHWIGRTYNAQWAPLRALWQNSPTDVFVSAIETNTYFNPRMRPVQWNILNALWQTTAQDFSSSVPPPTDVQHLWGFSIIRKPL